MIEITLLIFIPYAVFLWLLFSVNPSIFTALLLMGTQIGLGIPVTRAYNDLGLSTSSKLGLYDFGLHKTDEELFDLKIRTVDLHLVFEKLSLQVQKYDDGKSDDLMDISWFLVIVCAIISAVARYANYSGQLLSIIGVFVLLLACFMGYISGYWTKRESSFEESLEHLEYYVITLIKNLETVKSGLNSTLILRLRDRRRKSVLVDIAAEFVIKNVVLEYHIGLSSSFLERFIIRSLDTSMARIYEGLKTQQSILASGWTIEYVTIQSGVITIIQNPTTILHISDRNSYVVSPAVVERNSGASRTIMSSIISTIEGNFG